MIDFNTDKLIIVCYPMYAGGKFLINALGLSDNAVFQSIELATKQLNGKLGPAEKIKYLTDQINQVEDSWNDLNIGCYQFFGVENDAYLKKDTINFDSRISQVIDKNLYFFIVAHKFNYIVEYLNRWPNARIILLKNSKQFVSWRESDKFILQNVYGFEFDMNKFTASNHTLLWDTDWFFQKNTTVTNIEKLYQELDLPGFNREYVSVYYDSWISKLELLKHK